MFVYVRVLVLHITHLPNCLVLCLPTGCGFHWHCCIMESISIISFKEDVVMCVVMCVCVGLCKIITQC